MENSKVRAKHGNAIIYSNVELHCKYTICNKQKIIRPNTAENKNKQAVWEVAAICPRRMQADL